MDVKKTHSAQALSRSVTRPEPVSWGKSELSRFLGLAETQMLASYAILPRWVRALETIDDHLTNQAPTFFHEIDRDRRNSAKLFLRAFGTFRAACRLALSGQVYETTILTRSILESGVYAWMCCDSKDHRDAWAARYKGDAERKAARNAFGWSDLIKRLQKVDAGLADRVRLLYDQTIDFGAHPNVAGINLSLEVKHVDGDRHEISTIFIRGGDAVLAAVVDLLRAMLLIYELLELTIRDRLRILGIDQKVEAQHREVIALIQELEQRMAAGEPI